jgi:hypothetical protein
MKSRKLITNVLAIVGLMGVVCQPTAQAAQGDASFVTVTKNITANTRWTRDKVYLLARMVFVTNGAVLTIEPGTIVRGMVKGAGGTGFANEPGTLVISRTGKLIANGTPDDPIIMTAIDDTLVPGGIQTVPKSFRNAIGQTKLVIPKNYTPNGPTANNGFAQCEEWGGLVMLGRAQVSQGSGLTAVPRPFNDDGLSNAADTFVGADVIEGIDATRVPNTSGPGTPKLGVYGGTNDNDNSGVVRFVSIRYAGDVIGPSNELNSLTAGGLGAETVLEHIESTFNTDDGFEWFGGKNNPRFLFSLYNRDDAFDGDEGVRILGQFWTAFQGADTAVRSNYPNNNSITGHANNSSPGASAVSYNQLMEFDGPESPSTISVPSVTAVELFNYTFVGRGTLGSNGERGIRFRERAHGFLRNGLFEVFPGSDADSVAAGVQGIAPSTSSVDLGSYKLEVNNFYHLSPEVSAPLLAALDSDGTAATGNSNRFTAIAGANAVAEQVESKLPYNRSTGGGNTGVDLRLKGAAAARGASGPLPAHPFIRVGYAGSQRDNTHLNGWSNLQYLGVLPSNHPTRLSTSVTFAGSNAQISFQFRGRGGSTVDYPTDTIFVVERSVDGRTWTPILFNPGVNTVTNGSPEDLNADAQIITVQDPEALGATPVRYRVFAL